MVDVHDFFQVFEYVNSSDVRLLDVMRLSDVMLEFDVLI
jgi:hypothetical protein